MEKSPIFNPQSRKVPNQEEREVIALKRAIQKGLDSPRVENFSFDENLKGIKAKRKNDV